MATEINQQDQPTGLVEVRQSGAMSDDALIRLENLRALCRRRGLTPSVLRTLTGKSDQYWSALLKGKKSFGEEAARTIEEKFHLPRGWLDQPQAEDSGTAGIKALTAGPGRPDPPGVDSAGSGRTDQPGLSLGAMLRALAVTLRSLDDTSRAIGIAALGAWVQQGCDPAAVDRITAVLGGVVPVPTAAPDELSADLAAIIGKLPRPVWAAHMDALKRADPTALRNALLVVEAQDAPQDIVDQSEAMPDMRRTQA